MLVLLIRELTVATPAACMVLLLVSEPPTTAPLLFTVAAVTAPAACMVLLLVIVPASKLVPAVIVALLTMF